MTRRPAVAPSRLHAGLLLMLLSTLGFSQPARAQPEPLDEDALAAALTGEAEELYRHGNYEAALDRYNDAYRASPRPELIFDVAQCHRRLGQHRAALVHYNTFLKLAPDSPHADQVRALIADSRLALARTSSEPTEADTTAGPTRVEASDSPGDGGGHMPGWSANADGTNVGSEAGLRDEDSARIKRRRRIAISAAVIATLAGGATAAAMRLRSRGDDSGPAAMPADQGTLGVIEWR